MNRSMVIATMHGKERVIAPLFKEVFNITSVIPKAINTDEFGTFTGEVERVHHPIEAARLKCLKAMEITGADLGIASEGSFGPHPTFFFAPADSEVVILIDKTNGREYIASEISTRTNFSATEVTSYSQLLEFATSAQFPTHGLILRTIESPNEEVRKGIADPGELKKVFDQMFSRSGKLRVETDMRAHYNPTRMEVIKIAVQKLIDKLNTSCPQCEAPGYCISHAIPGLQCEQCGLPTRSTLAYAYQCDVCKFKEEKKYPNNKKYEEPTYCDFCNP